MDKRYPQSVDNMWAGIVYVSTIVYIGIGDYYTIPPTVSHILHVYLFV